MAITARTILGVLGALCLLAAAVGFGSLGALQLGWFGLFLWCLSSLVP